MIPISDPLSRPFPYTEIDWEPPITSEELLELASPMSPRETVTLPDGRILTEAECYIEAINLNPSCSEAFYLLGKTIRPGESVTLGNGLSYTAQECYLTAVSLGLNSSDLFHNLGTTIPPDEAVVVEFPNGFKAKFTAQMCYLEAIKIDPEKSISFYNLGFTVLRGQRVTLHNGEVLSEIGCYMKSVELNSGSADLWCTLGAKIPNNKSFKLPKSKMKVTKQLCFLMAIGRDSRCFTAWVNLADTIPIDDPIPLLDGKSYSREYCLCKALEINPNHALAWARLGDTIRLNHHIEFPNGLIVTKAYCYTKARTLSPIK